MGIETFLMQLSQYGTAPILLVLIFMIGLFWRRLEKKEDEDQKRSAALKGFLEGLINDLKKDFDERFAANNKRIEDLQSKVASIERDYLPRDDHYRDFSGWRAELEGIRTLIISLFKEQPKK